jgi:hypothetical protein
MRPKRTGDRDLLPGVVASIQGQERALNQDVELWTEEAPSQGELFTLSF